MSKIALAALAAVAIVAAGTPHSAATAAIAKQTVKHAAQHQAAPHHAAPQKVQHAAKPSKIAKTTYHSRLAHYRSKVLHRPIVTVRTTIVRPIQAVRAPYHHHHHAPGVVTVTPVVPVVNKTIYLPERPHVAAPVCTGMWSGQVVLPKRPGKWSVNGLGAVEITEDGSAILDCSKNSPAALKVVVANNQPPCLGEWSGVIRIDADKPGTVRSLNAGSAQVTADGRIVLACVAKR